MEYPIKLIVQSKLHQGWKNSESYLVTSTWQLDNWLWITQLMSFTAHFTKLIDALKKWLLWYRPEISFNTRALPMNLPKESFCYYLLVLQICNHILLEDLHICWRIVDPLFQLDQVFDCQKLSQVYSICICPI